MAVVVVASLSSLVIQMSDAPQTLQSRLIQVKTLVEIARLIACMPQLQNAEIEAILRNALKEAEALRVALQGLVVENDGSPCRKWAKAFSGIVKEKRVDGFLQRLEVEKSTHALYYED